MNLSRHIRTLSIALVLTLAGSLAAAESPKTKLPADSLHKVLDHLEIMSLSPASGAKIPGPPEGTTASGLNDSNSILITYQYKLQSSQEAQIRQWAWSAQNQVAYNNFWTWVPVSKGNGFAKTRLTVLCKKASQADTTVSLINYRFIKAAGGQIAPEPNELVNKVRRVNFTFTCGPNLQAQSMPINPAILNPDSLKIISLSPPSGSTIKGPPDSNPVMTASNSILITYEYKLQSNPHAQVRQWAWSSQNHVAQDNYWSWQPVDKGIGIAKTQLTVLCRNASQADTTVKFINYILFKAEGGKIADEPNTLVNKVEPVNYKFTCGP